MTKRQKREHVLTAYGGDVLAAYRDLGLPQNYLVDRKRAALTALAQIDAGKRWRDVLKEFER